MIIEYVGGDSNCVFVLSIPDWGVTPFAADRDRAQIAKEIDAFNAVNCEETESAGASYVDITSISREVIHDLRSLRMDCIHQEKCMQNGQGWLIIANMLWHGKIFDSRDHKTAQRNL